MLISKEEISKIINAVETDCIKGEVDVIECIKHKLLQHPKGKDLYLNWQRSDFNIDYGFRVCESRGLRLLHIAIMNNSYNTVLALIKAGADVNLLSSLVGRPIFLASLQKDSRILDALLKCEGISLLPEMTTQHTLLHSCALAGQKLETFKDVLELRRVDINVQDREQGYTPLHVAAERDRGQIVELLIANGADINIVDKLGEPPLFYALEHSQANQSSKAIVNQIAKQEDDNLYVSEKNINLRARYQDQVVVQTFLHNHGILIRALSSCYGHSFRHMEKLSDIKGFFEDHKDDVQICSFYQDNTITEVKKLEIDKILDFDDIKQVHVPKLATLALAAAIFDLEEQSYRGLLKSDDRYKILSYPVLSNEVSIPEHKNEYPNKVASIRLVIGLAALAVTGIVFSGIEKEKILVATICCLVVAGAIVYQLNNWPSSSLESANLAKKEGEAAVSGYQLRLPKFRINSGLI
ncbi:MAG: ankyrin repeat domain-containing protein [Wolbachia endosymbiont of Homalodisca vitripennis]|nr:ankyrin repeat domain-containing protein [Wolbachia endosymbiont of Homalodisca vitripennis]MCJ7454517.1 ankyrin repeat domain-containing protein [Wolbachia endosymbiont of Homalodisca vitripennis]MCJ7475506.1 ankyrin repeat domain-containing protein [Wolbachia endosymbiont of Homalodisca vitripennis]